MYVPATRLRPENRIFQSALHHVKLPFPFLASGSLLAPNLVEARRHLWHTLFGAGRQVELETAIDIDRDRIASAILEAVAAEV